MKYQTYIPPNINKPKNRQIGTENTAKCKIKDTISRPLSPHPKPKAIEPKISFKSIISLFIPKKSSANKGLFLKLKKTLHYA
jgi:hypothetical protein